MTKLPDDGSSAVYNGLSTPKHAEPYRMQINPLAKANWISRAFLLWFDPLATLGAQTTLSEEDVWPISAQDSAEYLHCRFQDVHKQGQPRISFFRSLISIFKPELLNVLGLYTLSAILTLCQPIVIKSFLQVLQAETDQFKTDLGIKSGYVLAFILFLLSFLAVTVMDLGMVYAGRLGCNGKALAIDTIFAKVLRLSATARQTISSGDIVTLATVDASRIFMCGLWYMWLIMTPFMLITIFILIGVELGPWPAVVGGASMVILLYFGYREGAVVGLIQKDILSVQGERVKFTNEVLQGVRSIKLYNWEQPLQDHIESIRQRELKLLRTYHFRRQVSSIALLIAPVLSLAIALLVFVAQGYALSTPIAFITLAYANAARTPCSAFSFSIMNLFDAINSCKRIDVFLASDEVLPMLPEPPTVPAVNLPSIELVKSAFSWTTDGKIILNDINLTIRRESLTIVVGVVGSGKSSLLQAILGEMCLIQGSRNVSGDIAYVAQDPWIQHATIKENILFNNVLDEKLYNDVLDTCHLSLDMANLPSGDKTEIGESGTNLSGGQKARVSLARAAYRYQEAGIYLLDDPLSALDVNVAGSVFRDCIQGLLKDKSVVMTLNSHYHLLSHADRIIVLGEGTIIGDGDFQSIKNMFPEYASSTQILEHEEVELNDLKVTKQQPAKSSSAKLVEAEERQVGQVSVKTYTTYFQASGKNGTLVAVSILCMFVITQTSLVMLDWFQGFWGASRSSLSQTTNATIYGVLALLCLVFMLGRSIFVLHFILLCSKQLHSIVLSKVLRAPVHSFFDVNPVGRILNRFSSDLSQVDNMVPMLGLHIFGLLFQIIASLIVCAATSPYVVAVYIPLSYLFIRVRKNFSLTATQLKRMDNISRSSVVANLGEALLGGPTIRAFGQGDMFIYKHRAALDFNQSFDMMHFISTKWFQMRLDWVSVIVVGAVAFLAIPSKDWIGVTAAGLALTYAIQLTIVLSRTTMEFTYMEGVMTSAERLNHYKTLDEEEQTSIISADPHWPQHGAVSFKEYSMRYREHLDLALRNISFDVRGGEKVGICGRTGSGKSSLMAALFRTVTAANGSICIDGIDIACVDLNTLRSRLTIIPQDPVLFSGSMRFNLDPSGVASDADLWRVLQEVQLADAMGLDFEVAEKGGNLSVGQRQLLCIARALLRQSRVVVLDEATASIDLESDRLIQETLRGSFKGVTMLVIAHRLDTILDSDRILVMDEGQVVEFDTPTVLLSKKDGTFSGLASQAKLTNCLE